MPDIKENIQTALLEKINNEWIYIAAREAVLIPWSVNEQYQIDCEKRFLKKMEDFIKSL